MKDRQRSEEEWQAIRKEIEGVEDGDFIANFSPIQGEEGEILDIVGIADSLIDINAEREIRYLPYTEPRSSSEKS